MTKQEFLAMSLLYGLKMCYTYENRIDIQTLLPMHFDCKCQLVNERGKPVLYPLSDLTKEIEHNGEKFVPIDELNNIGDAECDRYNDYFNEENISDVNWLLEPFIIFQKLIEWHFAVGLNSDDYIDLNSLEVNPYK